MLNERAKAILSKLTCSVDEAGEVLGLSRPSIVAAIERKELAATKLGARYIIPTAPLRRLDRGAAPR